MIITTCVVLLSFFFQTQTQTKNKIIATANAISCESWRQYYSQFNLMNEKFT